MLLRRQISVGMRIFVVLALMVIAMIPSVIATPASAVVIDQAELAMDLDMTAGYQGQETKTVIAGESPNGDFSVEVYAIVGVDSAASGIDCFLDFNKDELELVYIGVDTSTFTVVSYNKGDTPAEIATANTLGNADFGLQTAVGAPGVSGTFLLATIDFHRKAGTGNTGIGVHIPRANPRNTAFAVGEGGMLTAYHDATISGITVNITLPATATAGTPCNGTVTVKSGEDTLTTYAGTLHFTSTDAVVDLPVDYTFNGAGDGKDNGTHIFSFTFKTAGNQTVTATDTNPADGYTGTSGAVTVGAGTATKIKVETLATGAGVVVPPQDLISGNTLVVYSISRDAYDNFVANAAATWSFTGLDPATGGVVAGDLIPAGDGKSATMTGHVIGKGAIRATSGTLTKTDSGLITVKVGAASQVKIETLATGAGVVVPAQNLVSGNPLTVYSITRDASNNFVANAAATWTFSTKTVGVADGDLVAAGDGKSAVMTGHVVGTGVIHAVTTVGSFTADSNTITVTPGTAAYLKVTGTATMVAGTTNALTITAYDASGNVATGYTGTKSLTFSGLTAIGTYNPKVGTTNFGSATSVAFTSGVSNTGAAVLTAYNVAGGSVDVTDGTINSNGDAAYDLDLTVTPAGASTLQVTIAASVIKNVGTNVTVTAKDLYGNTATGYTGQVYFTSTDTAATLPASSTAPYTFTTGGGADNGVHIFQVTMQTYGAKTVTVTDKNTTTITGTASVTVIPAPKENPALTAGWNIFSTPFSLESGYRTWGQLAALNPDLSNTAKVESVYYYDPTSTTTPWKAVTSTYAVQPCDAIYVKVVTGQTVTVPLVNDTAFSMPSKNLYAGWNLIGLGYYNTNLAGSTMDVDDALTSIYKGTGAGDTWGYSQVISPPSCNQDTVANATANFIYIRDATTGVGVGWLPKLVATDGYWVFMVNNGKIGGFTGTPLP